MKYKIVPHSNPELADSFFYIYRKGILLDSSKFIGVFSGTREEVELLSKLEVFDNKNFHEPCSTLSWAAYHLFDETFSNKYADHRLTKNEKLLLFNASINHCIEMLSLRKSWEKEMKEYDKHRINLLIQLKNNLI